LPPQLKSPQVIDLRTFSLFNQAIGRCDPDGNE
jgi:hypothetical protein